MRYFEKVASTYLSSDDGDNACVHGHIWVTSIVANYWFCVAYAIFTIVWGLQFPVMDTLIMDAITEDVEHYIYKISYWMTNLSVAIGALLGGLMYGYSMLLLFLIAACIFLIVLFILYIWLPQDRNQVKQSDDKRHASRYQKNYK